jgi:7-cyano-7-deazaguanine synthase
MTDEHLEVLEQHDRNMLESRVRALEPVTRVFCLLSGGVDSTTTLAIARAEFPDASFECVTVDYGQRHKKEMECAAWQASHYDADHHILDLSGLLTGMLVDKGSNNEAIPDVSYADLPTGMSPTYVSFRNGTMLAILAARAQTWVIQMEAAGYSPEAVLYCGVHADDGVNWAYPDCTPEFIGAMANAIYVGTYHKVRLRAPLQYLNKTEVVDIGLRHTVEFAHTWSCYKGEDLHCGTCPTCRSRRDAFFYNGEQDPVCYADQEVQDAS